MRSDHTTHIRLVGVRRVVERSGIHDISTLLLQELVLLRITPPIHFLTSLGTSS